MLKKNQAYQPAIPHTDPEPLERRKEPRKKVLIHAFVSDFDDTVDLKCVIRDISKGGCRIASSYVQDLPRLVKITPEGFEKPMVGKIVWRNSKFAGVQFVNAAEAKEINETQTPRLHAPEPVGFFAKLTSMMSLRRSSGQASRHDHPGRSGYTVHVLHGLRNPLTSIKNLLGLLLGDTVRPIPRRAKSVIKAAHQNADNAEKLISEALCADNIESGQLPCKPAPLEIVEFIRDAALVNTGFAAKYSVRFDITDDVGAATVNADQARLGEVMASLLSLAACYSPVGETVSIGLRRNRDAIRVSVTDKGAGSDILHGDADGKHVTRDGDDDLGVGLDFSRAVLRQHDSELHVDSHSGSGTTVWFELPERSV